MPRVILIHGWGGSPSNDWIPWAKEKLSEVGYETFVLEMPETDHPKIDLWVNKLKEVVGETRENDVFVGHSIGCQAILRYLETISNKVAKVILIAPWWYLILDEGEEQADADPWLKVDVDFEKIKSKSHKFVAVFSDNDPFVPLEKNTRFFKEKLNSEIVVKSKMGHFTQSDGVTQIPFLVELIIG